MPDKKNRAYWDESRQKWMIDDYGRPREATPEEVEAAMGDHQK
jgi:hypothetical protein